MGTRQTVDSVIDRTVALAVVPAPSFEEAVRASVVLDWWKSDGLHHAHIDEVGNVWGRVREGSGAATVVCAHLDTVFDRQTELKPTWEGSNLRAPGVGDNTVGVAALGTLSELLPLSTLQPVWVLATVGEEGLGNLRGINFALDRPPCDVGALIAVEGNYLGRICTVGVGSIRWSVTVRAPGGHAWENAASPSAVHVAARAVTQLDCLPSLATGRTSVNVGRFLGGEAINARALSATFDLDLRSDSEGGLSALGRGARGLITELNGEGVTTEIQELGHRPAGALSEDHPLGRAAAKALEDLGLEPRFTAASTDANAAHARQIPALAVGVVRGGGEHTPSEWIDTASLDDGLRALSATVACFDRSLR